MSSIVGELAGPHVRWERREVERIWFESVAWQWTFRCKSGLGRCIGRLEFEDKRNKWDYFVVHETPNEQLPHCLRTSWNSFYHAYHTSLQPSYCNLQAIGSRSFSAKGRGTNVMLIEHQRQISREENSPGSSSHAGVISTHPLFHPD